MKTKLVSIFIPLILLSGCSTVEKKNNLAEMNLKGKVQSKREISYEAIDKFGKITKGKRLPTYELSDEYILFNEMGNKIRYSLYYTEGSLLYTETYNYDDNGNRIERNFGVDEFRGGKWLYKYDSKGRRIEEIEYKPDGSINRKHFFKYGAAGNKIEKKEYKSDGSLENISSYKYDDKGNQIEENRFNSDGNLNVRETYQYDDEGNLIEDNVHYSDGTQATKTTYTYDNDKNIIMVIRFDLYQDIDGNQYEVTTYKYEYDSKNNWIKRTEFDNKIPKYIIEREIEYYK